MSACIHCDQVVTKAFFADSKEKEDLKVGPFCCQGCLSVYNLLNQKGLEDYYRIKENSKIFKKRNAVDLKEVFFSYLDDSAFLKEYSYKNYNNESSMDFYLEGIHCLACLWLIEKLPTFLPGVTSSKLNMEKSVVTVSLNETGHFASIAREFNNLGYRPHPLKKNHDSSELKIKENRSTLLKIGIAGAAAGNIMLYSVSNYAGAGGQYEQIFNLITVLFAIPVLTYCSYPFYRSSWNSLKNKTLSIDVPISLALIMGAVMGLYNLLKGIPENYFDSLTALVFLLLLSRYFLKVIQEKGLSVSDLHFFYQGESVLKIDEDGHTREIHPRFISIGDVLKISANQIIPADGIVIQGESYLNNSLLSGESRPDFIQKNTHVYSGTLNISNEILIRVEKSQNESRLAEILRGVENGWTHKAKIVDLTHKVSKYFVAVVFLLAIILFSISNLDNALTLLIVTCPCALAIATPLAFTRTLSKAAQRGIIIKDDSVIEKIASAKNIFIDKTGTITEATLQVSNLEIMMTSKVAPTDIIYNLEKNSTHPVGRTLFESVTGNPIDVTDYVEIPGIGVQGSINGQKYEIRNNKIYENSNPIAQFDITDQIRVDSKNTIETLRKIGLKIALISGDTKKSVQKTAHLLDLKNDEWFYELSPESKAQIIKSTKNAVMVGDGANDAIALGHADIGIAVFGAMDISLKASDVYLNQSGLMAIVELFTISKETMKVVYRNLYLSLFYNSISVVLAFTGLISPLTAAIVMPLSSLTVLISTMIGTKKLRVLWKS